MKIYKNLNIGDIKGEGWMDCIGYDGIYSVSNLGRVKAEQREVRCGKGFYVKPSTIMKQQVVKSNPHNVRFESKHLAVSFCVDYCRKTYNVSELVGNAFIGKRENGLTFDHIETNNQNNRADNIRLATKAEQSQNRNVSKNNKLGVKNIFIKKNKNRNSYQIRITRNGKMVFNKIFSMKKYSLEDCIRIRDEFLEHLI